VDAEQIKKDSHYAPGFNSFLNLIKDGIVVTSVSSKVILLNNSSALLSANKYENIYGKSIYDLAECGVIKKPSKSEFEAIFSHIISGQTVKFEMSIKGNEHTFIVIGYPVYKRGEKVNRILFTSNDKLSKLNLDSKVDISNLAGLFSDYHQNESDMKYISQSDNMRQVIKIAHKVANVDSPVFLTGETGVGKSLLAQYIHNVGGRKNDPFIQINCAAIPDNLFESEVFGYEQGAFTGASRHRKLGMMELAKEGTIFLDEITELSPILQAKLLQVMQEGEFWRLGGSSPIQLKARVISATNHDIRELVKEKKFREDLYYRMCVVPVDIPPLRERWEDILLLAEDFIDEFNKKYRTNKYFNQDIIFWLNQYEWPGNVRELKNVVERMAIVSDKDEISLSDIPNYLLEESSIIINDEMMSLKEANEKLEKEYIRKVLSETKNYREAADILCVSQSTLIRKISKYGLKIKDYSTL
jgi:transcriptional regulator with PAS, ATPase and Fis domain